MWRENRWSHRKWKETWFIEYEDDMIANKDNWRTLPQALKKNVN
jgi:hypothetical protein